MANPPAIDIRNGLRLHGRPGSMFALSIPEFRVRAGEVCVIAGRSGCGKTSLLDLLGCISPFSRCERFDMCMAGRTIDMRTAPGHVMAGMRRLHLGYVLQQAGLLPFLTAWENILLPLRLSGRLAYAGQAMKIVQYLGLEGQLHKRPAELSVGQRQRVDIVRALAPRPEILLADEPTGALDPLTAERVCAELLRVVKALGTTLVLVSHDVQLFRKVGERFFGFELSHRQGMVVSTVIERENLSQG